MSDFFKFENKEVDFPFYNGIPKLSSADWIILLLAVIIEISLIVGVIQIPSVNILFDSIIYPVLYMVVLLIPILYVSKGNFRLIFRKPQKSDIPVVIICVVVYIIFTLAMAFVLNALGFNLAANSVGGEGISSIVILFTILVQLIGEELIKVIVFLLSMGLIYHIIQDRKISVIVSIAVACIVFGLVHLESYDGNIVQCLLVIGLGCVIHFYPYIKTKNIVNSYLTHLLIDLLLFLPSFFATGLI